MRGDKGTHSKGGRLKIPLLPNNEGKRAGQQGHNMGDDIDNKKIGNRHFLEL